MNLRGGLRSFILVDDLDVFVAVVLQALVIIGAALVNVRVAYVAVFDLDLLALVLGIHDNLLGG